MTAAAGVLTGLAKLKRQDSARSQHRPIPPSSPGLGNPTAEVAPRKRKRRSDVVVVRGRLRLYSASGFFLFLGLIILAIGIGMATLGYWPHSKTKPTGGGAGVKAENDVANTSHDAQGTTSEQTGGTLMRFLGQHLHSERMKMLGPFTMGIGIFIFICANAILHENRDRETKIIHMRDMYSTVIDIHRLRQKEEKEQYYRNSTCGREAGDLRTFGADAAARLASNSLLAFSSRAGSGGGGSTEEEEVLLGDEQIQRHREAKLDCNFAGLLAPLYKDRPFSGPGLGLGRSDSMRHQWSVDGEGEKGGHHAGSIVSSSISAFTLPVIKLNNCVIDEPEMEAITEEDRGGEIRDGERSKPMSSMESLVVPVASIAKAFKPPGLHRSNSASSSSRCSSFSSSTLSPAPSSTSGCWLSPGAARSDFGSNSSLHMLNSHSKSLDLERDPSMLSVHQEQRKHPSWPRLDRSNSSRSHTANRSSSKGYMRLDDREDQGEWLLDVLPSVTVRRDYSKREKLLMISRSHNNLSFEHDEFNSSALKRGSSETRF
ncbi:transmembrane protein 200A [Melanotaenia boesemani]|uniref:transmembrane protein 200A n=1 Tax=Melanotaenia boesemani TaxID=1250792 RepID=UPI001C03FA29|nr:transmembrane protein 200A [Melanotaenia boesemani]XP_041832294.1 transmembrane protein 200A [Melanotaenia boesemani]